MMKDIKFSILFSKETIIRSLCCRNITIYRSLISLLTLLP